MSRLIGRKYGNIINHRDGRRNRSPKTVSRKWKRISSERSERSIESESALAKEKRFVCSSLPLLLIGKRRRRHFPRTLARYDGKGYGEHCDRV